MAAQFIRNAIIVDYLRSISRVLHLELLSHQLTVLHIR